MSNVSDLIQDALDEFDEVEARTRAWKAVPSDRLHGWYIHVAYDDHLRFFKMFGTERREAMFPLPEEMTVPTETAIIYMSYKLLKIERDFSSSH